MALNHFTAKPFRTQLSLYYIKICDLKSIHDITSNQYKEKLYNFSIFLQKYANQNVTVSGE